MTGTFKQPDFESDSGTEYKTNIDNSISVMSRIGASFAPHEQDTPNMTIRVDAGNLWVDGGVVEVGAQSSATISSPATYSRIDRIIIGSTAGTVSILSGTPATSPVAPVIPENKLPICKVTLATTTTAITNSLITDERVNWIGINFASNAEAEAGVITNKAIAPSQLQYGGRMKLVESKELTGATSATFTGLLPGHKYKLYVRLLQNTSNSYHYMRFNADSGNNYTTQVKTIPTIGADTSTKVTTNAFLFLTHNIDVILAGAEATFHIFFNSWLSDHHKVNIRGDGVFLDANDSGHISDVRISGNYRGAADLTSMTYSCHVGTMTGLLELYETIS